MKNVNRLNVGVLFYNNERLVNPFFFFLRKSTIIPLRIIAVNNGSSDGTGAELEKQMTKDDVLITVKENQGCAKGGNLILKKIKEIEGGYRSFLSLNSDIFIVRMDSINRMCDTLTLNPDCGIVYGRSLAFHHTTSNFGIYSKEEWNFAFHMIRKEVFEQCGEYDPNFQVYYADSDFAARVSKQGWKSAECDQSLAIHLQAETTYWGSAGGEIRKKNLEHDKKYYEEKWKCKIPEVK